MSDDVKTGFVRQRRNLILVSLTLFFALAHIATFDKISVFGTDLGLKEKLNPIPYLWIAFVYLAWRYYSYLHDLGDKGIVSAHRVKLQEFAAKIAVQDIANDPMYQKVINDRLTQIGTGYKWKYRDSSYGPKTPSRSQMTLMISLDAYDPEQTFPTKDLELKYPIQVQGYRYFLAQIRAWAYVLFRTRLFSEYVVPFLVAAMPVLYVTYRCIV